MDEFLAKLNLWRKPIAKDGRSLFRSLSEQIYNTQAHHQQVERVCLLYMKVHRAEFAQLISIDFDEYVVGLENHERTAGVVEMRALSRIFKRDFLIYEGAGRPPMNVTWNGYPGLVLLCHFGNNHFDCIYPQSFMQKAALCQSIIYEILYRNVFKLDQELEEAVYIIRNQARTRRRRHLSGCSNSGNERNGSPDYNNNNGYNVTSCNVTENSNSNAQVKEHVTPPVPYRICKALDPEIYRNVELDIWQEEKRENQKCHSLQFGAGDKCQVSLEDTDSQLYIAHIQEIGSDEISPVVAFIEDLGEKKTVPYSSLRPLPAHLQPPINIQKSLQFIKKKFWKKRQIMPVVDTVKQNTTQEVSRNNGSPVVETSSPFTNEPVIHPPQIPKKPVIETTESVTAPQNHLHIAPYYPPLPPQNYPTQITPHPVVQVPVNPAIWVPYLEMANNQINLGTLTSNDVTGKDLPISDMNTLRFFFNLGVEYYRAVSQLQVEINQPPMMPVPILQPNSQECYNPPMMDTQSQQEIVYINGQCFRNRVPNKPATRFDYNLHADKMKFAQNVSPPSNSKENNHITSSNAHSEQLETSRNVSPLDSGCSSDSGSDDISQSFSVPENSLDPACSPHSTDSTKEDRVGADEMDLSNGLNACTLSKADSHNCMTPDKEQNETAGKKAKRKYFMYGSHKLVKPIKDIPPRFLAMLLETSAEKARCEGQPIVIQNTREFIPEDISNKDTVHVAPSLGPQDPKCTLSSTSYPDVPYYTNGNGVCTCTSTISVPHSYSCSHPNIHNSSGDGHCVYSCFSSSCTGYSNIPNVPSQGQVVYVNTPCQPQQQPLPPAQTYACPAVPPPPLPVCRPAAAVQPNGVQ